MERRGWVRSEWKQTESNQRAKYFRITAAGKKQLSHDLGCWQQMADAVAAIMQREPGWVTMSERDLQRIEVLTEVLAGRRTMASAAAVLAVSGRQTQRLLTRYHKGGRGAIIHKARGRASNYRLSAGVRDFALEPIRQNYHDFEPTLAAEVYCWRDMGLRCRGRPCASGWSKPAFGSRASSAVASINRVYDVSVLAN